MSIIYVPRLFGTLILNITPPQLPVPGVAIVSDALRGQAAIGDVLRGQAATTDVNIGQVILSDQA